MKPFTIKTMDKKLDNPVWHSLNETHQNFALHYHNIKFYHPDYCPCGGFISVKRTISSVNVETGRNY